MTPTPERIVRQLILSVAADINGRLTVEAAADATITPAIEAIYAQLPPLSLTILRHGFTIDRDLPDPSGLKRLYCQARVDLCTRLLGDG